MSRMICILTLLVLMPFMAHAGPVNINTADAPTLARELKGVGLSRAEAIVAYRRDNGPFNSPEDLKRVKGIGPQVLELNAGNIRVSEPDSAR